MVFLDKVLFSHDNFYKFAKNGSNPKKTNLKMTRFGKFLKEQRESRGWTQTDFGAKIGINSSAISRIEKGTKILSSGKLILIAEIFGMSLSHVKELYYSDKIALEILNNDCPESTLAVAEETVRYLKQKRLKQSELKF